MDSGTWLVITLYAIGLPAWALLSLRASRRSRAWAFTPPWHRRAVPLFRAFMLATLPLEYLLAGRVFVPAVFAIGAAGTLGWLAWRAAYLHHAPHTLPRQDSVRYNAACVANLAAFALACHSFVCLAVMINVSVPLLLVRERLARAGAQAGAAA